MNLATISIGVLILFYSIFVLILRLKGKDNKFGKLEPMKKRFGNKTGSIIHYIGYVVIPFILGISVIYAGFVGISIIRFLLK